MRVVLLVFALMACTDSVAPPDGSGEPPELRLVSVAGGLTAPVHLTAPPGDARLFVVEQPGRIRIIENGALRGEPFLDITANVGSGGERGLLGLAFHPDYASNGYFFVDYTDRGGDTRIERYRVSPDPNRADPASAKLILTVQQPFANHNGGLVAFGPDGMLYIGLGDGGSGGDPLGHGQNRGTLLGSLLRIDADGGDPYAIPAGNPFVGQAGARPEIWAYGLRNPWRFAFDREAGMLYIADVGQNRLEEINAVSTSTAGINFGWNVMEGTECYAGPGCSTAGLTLPVLEYDHGEGCSVTGGMVYRGDALPVLNGHYFYADFCRGWIRSFRLENGSPRDQREWPLGDVGQILSFGEDSAGELYVLATSGGQGTVYRIAPAD